MDHQPQGYSHQNSNNKHDGIRFGYARTCRQNLAPQKDTLAKQKEVLTKAHCARVFTDTASGMTTNLPGLTEVLSHLYEGDTLVVCSLDRLSRSPQRLIELMQDLKKRGIKLENLQQPQSQEEPQSQDESD